MAYKKLNLLEKILEIQEITLQHTRKGVSQRWVFENIVRPRYFISLRTYNTYLATNARAQIQRIRQGEKEPINIF